MSSQPFSYMPMTPEALSQLDACRTFGGPPGEFWSLFVQAAASLTRAARVRALVRLGDQWRLLATFPAEQAAVSAVPEAVFRSAANRAFVEGLARAGSLGSSPLLVSLDTGEEQRNCLLELTFSMDGALPAEMVAAVAGLVSDTPRLYQRNRQQQRLEHDASRMASALEVFAAVNAHRRFEPAAMALVNETAARFGATRASLGWVVSPYVRVVAMSGTERFERRMQVMQLLEAAMEETRDQEDEIFWPALPESDLIVRDHDIYGRENRLAALLSAPLRIDGAVCGVLVLEREDGRFSEEDAIGLRVVADQTSRTLRDLKDRDVWFGRRWARGARKWFAGLLGPRNTWLKVGALTGAVTLFVCAVIPFSYRVEGTFIVRPESSAHLPAPFDGYLAQVNVRPGDEVTAAQPLVLLDRGDLRVEEAAALAEIRRYNAETDRAEATRNLAELRVAKALAEQAEAKLNLIRFRLERADIRAPFDGVIVAGDLRDRLGVPIKQGEILLQVAQLDGLFVEIRLPERDIDLLSQKRVGEIAFASRPDMRFPITIERIEPGAVPDRDGNFFIVRAHMDAGAEWLRPGMSGVAKLDAGRRTLLWRGTHRLVDFLRMKLWL